MPLTAAAGTAIAGGLAALGTGVSAVVGSNLNKKNRAFYEDMTNRQNAFNAAQADLAFQRQQMLYDYQFNKETKYNEEYNSPLAQMQRLKEAGLNPALMMSNGVDNTVTPSASMSSAPQASASEASPPQMQNFMQQLPSQLLQFGQLISQNALNKANIAKTDKEILKLDKDIELTTEQSNKVKEETNQLKYTIDNILPHQSQELKAKVNQILQDIQNSQQLTAAQVASIKQSILNAVQDENIKRSQSKKLEIELNKYDEYTQNIYKKAAADAGLSAQELEYQNELKGLRTRILKGMTEPFSEKDPQSWNTLIHDLMSFFLLKAMQF